MKPSPIVGVRELRTHLSAYLREVARGGTVTLGDRNKRPIARLVPVERDPDLETLEARARRGTITLGKGKPLVRPISPRRGSRLVSDIVVEDRR
jgi:prevent-host-death family protein